MNKKLYVFAAALCLLPCSALAQNKVFDRGYDFKKPSAVVAPEKSWMLGGSLGVAASSQKDYQFFVVNGINANGLNISFAPQFCYHFKDNMGIGCRLKYSRLYESIESANAEFSKDLKINIRNYNLLTQSYMAALFYRYYLPFGKSGRVAGFFEGEASGGAGKTKVLDAHSVDQRGAYESSYNFGLCGNVGLVVLFTPHFAIDLNLSLVEFDYYSNSQDINQVEHGNLSYGTANFMFNLLSIAIGLNYYL